MHTLALPGADDEIVIELLSKVVVLAQRDAARGDADAAAWIADLQAHRPRSIRLNGAGPTLASERARAAILTRWRRVA